MYQAASGTLLILTKNPRFESLLWHIYIIKYLSTLIKNAKGISSNFYHNFNKIFIFLCRIILLTFLKHLFSNKFIFALPLAIYKTLKILNV